MKTQPLIKELKITKEKLYEKFKDYKLLHKKIKVDKLNQLVSKNGFIVSEVFDIPYYNKEAIFFILVGLETIEKKINEIMEIKNG